MGQACSRGAAGDRVVGAGEEMEQGQGSRGLWPAVGAARAAAPG